MALITREAFLLALDAGDTMTDTFLVDESGEFVLGKGMINRQNEDGSYLESVHDAAFWGKTSSQIHQCALSSTYRSTTKLKTLMTLKGSKVGPLITTGFAHLQP